MKASRRQGLIAGLLAILLAEPALGFDYPLSREAIREAYFLGKASPEKLQAFLQPYKHELPAPERGPEVALIEVETPFTFIAENVSRTGLSYHAQEAEQDFLGKPEPFRIHVEIYFTATYPGPETNVFNIGAFWRDFTVRVKQKAEISARKVVGRPINNDATISGYAGATIDADYDAGKIDPGAPTTVEVDTPDGQHVETSFDLASLR